jgi:hypothetical protein
MTFEDLYRDFEDRQAWLEEVLTDMSFAEFDGLVTFIFERLDVAAAENDGIEFNRVKGLLLAVARKQLEAANSLDTTISVPHRESLMKAADSMFVCAKGFYPPTSQPAVQAAWDASLDGAAHFGYRAAGVFEVMARDRLKPGGAVLRS